MTEHHRLHADQGAERGEKGLKRNAIGFIDGLIIGIASTAPAYSLAAVLGIVVVGVSVQAPAVRNRPQRRLGRRLMGIAAVPEEAV